MAGSEQVRRSNVSALLGHVHKGGPTARSVLARRMKLNRSTIGALVNVLTEAGLVSEGLPATRSVAGRPSLIVAPRHESAWVAAADIRPTAIVVARIGLGGQLIEQRSESWSSEDGYDPGHAVEAISEMVTDLRASAPVGSKMVGVAVAVPGMVRSKDGLVRSSISFEWENVPLSELLSMKLGSGPEVQIANRADLGALAEVVRGAAVGVDHVLYLNGTSGVGGGIVSDGALLAGAAGYAGEIGHMRVNPAGDQCHCGGNGCWESEISVKALLRRAGHDSLNAGHDGVRLIMDAAASGDDLAVRAIEETGEWMARGLGSLINVLNPQMVVFGGMLKSVFEAVSEVVIERLPVHASPNGTDGINLATPALAPNSSLIGASELAFSTFLSDPLGTLEAF